MLKNINNNHFLFSQPVNAGSAWLSNVFQKVPQVFPYCTETGGSVGPSVYDLQAKCEQSR